MGCGDRLRNSSKVTSAEGIHHRGTEDTEKQQFVIEDLSFVIGHFGNRQMTNLQLPIPNLLLRAPW
jgi:hypothetical protein